MFTILLTNKYRTYSIVSVKWSFFIALFCLFVRLNETEFMEFSDIENHDDFYTVEEGRIHVQDQRGYYIVYDSAEKDLK